MSKDYKLFKRLWSAFVYLLDKDSTDENIERSNKAIIEIEKLLPFKDEKEHEEWLDKTSTWTDFDEYEKFNFNIAKRLNDGSLEEDWTNDVSPKDKKFIEQEVRDTLDDVKYGTSTVNNGVNRIMGAIVDTLDYPEISDDIFEYEDIVDEDFDEDFDELVEDNKYYAYKLSSSISGTKVYLLHKDYDTLNGSIDEFKRDFLSYINDGISWEDLLIKYEDNGFILGDSESETVYKATLDDEDENSDWGYFYDGVPVEIIETDSWRF